MKELYGIDMEKKQYSKLISSIPEPDISISMGYTADREEYSRIKEKMIAI